MTTRIAAVLLPLLFVFGCEQHRAAPVATTRTAPAPSPPAPSPSPPAPPSLTTPGAAPRPAPPPPPGPPQPQPPPTSVATFLHAHAADAAPWRVTYARGRVRKHLTPANAAELALRLSTAASYIDGDYGCVGDPVNYVLARGPSTFAFVEDCGHMQIGGDHHAALFSSEMLGFLQRTRGDR